MSPRASLALVALAFATRAPVFLGTFWNGDEATYAALANAVLGGEMPYVGAVDHKPPLLMLTYALVLGIFGRGALGAVHLVSVTAVAATGVLLGHVGRGLGWSPRAAALGGAMFIVFSAVGPPQDALAANGEIFMLLPTVGAMAVVAGDLRGSARVGTRRWGLAGLLAGLATLFKYQGAAVLLPLAVAAGRLPGRGRRLGALLLGAAVPLAALVAVYLGAGELDALRFWGWTYPLRYAAALAPDEVARRALVGGLGWALPSAFLLAAAALGARALRRDGANREAGLVVLWLVASLVGTASGGRFFLHYFLQILPPLALLAGSGLDRVWTGPASSRWRLAAVAGAGLPLIASWGGALFDARVRPRVAAHTEVYRRVGGFIDQRAGGTDTLLVWGNSPEIYHYARRDMGTRFPFCNHLSGKIWGTPHDRPGAPEPSRRAVAEAWPMLFEDLDHRRPDWIADAAAAGLDRWEGHELGRYPALAARVDEDYELVATVDGVPLFTRRSHRQEDRQDER